ncbi:MAG TPA: hypothetical protein ENO31_03320 [Thermoprotei archaeon]|nr:hypothetical protein [Thermoprotei archaeon]
MYPVYFAKYNQPNHDEEITFLKERLPALLKEKDVRVIGDAELAKALKELGLSVSFESVEA